MSDSLIRILALIPVGLLAAALFTASAPRLQASLAHLPVEQTIEQYRTAERPGADSLRRVVDDAIRGPRWHADARHLEGLGFLYWVLGRDSQLPASVRRRHLLSASAHLRASLARSPIQPYVWLRLARIELRLGAPSATRFGDALRMSLLTARVDEHLMLDRLRLGLRYFERLDSETRALLIDQMHIARNLVPQDYSNTLSRIEDEVERVVRIVRTENPERLLALEVALAPID